MMNGRSEISAAEQPPEIPTDLNYQVFDFAQVARIAVNQAGSGFYRRLGSGRKKAFSPECGRLSGLAESFLALDQ